MFLRGGGCESGAKVYWGSSLMKNHLLWMYNIGSGASTGSDDDNFELEAVALWLSESMPRF
jgi:hypothetical protein